MASDGSTGQIPVASPVQGSQAPTSISLPSGSGKPLPPGGKSAATALPGSAFAKPSVPNTTDPQALIDQLNKYLNDSGRPDQFRLDPASGGKLIQQVNPTSGAVIGEFAVSEFPALARSIGVSGLLVDSHA